MSLLRIDGNKCNLCGVCLNSCPFDALVMKDGHVDVTAGCRMCKLCIRTCPQNAIGLSEKESVVDKSNWSGITVFGEFNNGRLHPVTVELIGEAQRLTAKVAMPIHVVLIGLGLTHAAKSLLAYGIDAVHVYDHPALEHYRVDTYSTVFEAQVRMTKPSIVLIGGTSIGRSLAPRLACRFLTGLTADCTTLDIKNNTDLIQIRPAFGGNIMAQIITPNTRPQFATVRYKVMNPAVHRTIVGKVHRHDVKAAWIQSDIEVLQVVTKKASPSITDAETLIVAGQGIKSRDDLAMLTQLADILGGQLACTRPLVEKGWCDHTQQIGLSGRTVKPKLIITCGVAGAIQFTACMDQSECIVAINDDEHAPIFKVAHYGIVGDLYQVIPSLLEKLTGQDMDMQQALG